MAAGAENHRLRANAVMLTTAMAGVSTATDSVWVKPQYVASSVFH